MGDLEAEGLFATGLEDREPPRVDERAERIAQGETVVDLVVALRDLVTNLVRGERSRCLVGNDQHATSRNLECIRIQHPLPLFFGESAKSFIAQQ